MVVRFSCKFLVHVILGKLKKDEAFAMDFWKLYTEVRPHTCRCRSADSVLH